MGDNLRIPQQVVPKNYVFNTKPIVPPDQQALFDLVDLSKVLKTNERTDYNKNNQLLEQNPNSANDLSLKIAKDPILSSNTVKQLLSADTLAQLAQTGDVQIVQALNELSKNLFLSSETILKEIVNQEKQLSSFSGTFFDKLRELLTQTTSSQMKNTIMTLLKSMNTSASNPEILHALSLNFKHLASLYSANKDLSAQLISLSQSFELPESENNFSKLRTATIELLGKAANSILSTEKTKSLIPLVIYNLSRYNNNSYIVKDSLDTLLKMLNNPLLKQTLIETMPLKQMVDLSNEQLAKLMSTIADDHPHLLQKGMADLITQLESQGATKQLAELAKDMMTKNPDTMDKELVNLFKRLLGTDNLKEYSRSINERSNLLMYREQDKQNELLSKPWQQLTTVAKENMEQATSSMRSLVNFIASNYNNAALKALENFDANILMQSLLSAPGTMTPLLHFMLPLIYQDTQAFGELWVDKDQQQNSPSGGTADDDIHMLLVFDIEHFGRFEIDLYNHQDDVILNLTCPPAFAPQFTRLKSNISQIISTAGYYPKNTAIVPMVKQRNLTEVFPKLLEKRSGLDVKI